MNNVVSKTKIQETINEIYSLLNTCKENVKSLEDASREVKSIATKLNSCNGKRVLNSNKTIKTDEFIKKTYEKFSINGADSIITYANTIEEETEELNDKILGLNMGLKLMDEDLAIIAIYIYNLEKIYRPELDSDVASMSFLDKLKQAGRDMQYDAESGYQILHSYSILETGSINLELFDCNYDYMGMYLKYYNEDGYNVYAPLAKVQAENGKYKLVPMNEEEMAAFSRNTTNYYNSIMYNYDCFTPKMKDDLSNSLKDITLLYIDYDMETIDNFNWSAFAKKDESITVNMNQDFSYIANESFPHECGHVYDWSQSGYIEKNILNNHGISDKSTWTNIYGQLKEDAEINSNVLNDYSLSQPYECFADSVSAYYNRPEDLKEVEINIDGYNNLYDYMDDVLNY